MRKKETADPSAQTAGLVMTTMLHPCNEPHDDNPRLARTLWINTLQAGLSDKLRNRGNLCLKTRDGAPQKAKARRDIQDC